jgi:hypothetical protein
MESTPPVQTTTLASLLDSEKVIQPGRARTLLASLAQANALPTGPSTPREWAEQVLVISAPNGVERAEFREQTGAAKPLPDWAAHVARLIDALRAAAIAMLWGLDGAEAPADRRATPDGLPRFPRLRKLLIEQWDATRNTCDSADKFMMFFEATLALDRAAEPKVGREAFKTLSMQAIDERRRDVRVGTIGVPFAAITDTGKFTKGARNAPETAAPSGPQSAPPPAPLAPPTPPTVPTANSAVPLLIRSFGVHILIVIAVAIAVVYWRL